MVKLAVPPIRVLTAPPAPDMEKITVPVGVPAPGVDETTAVKVNGPYGPGLAEEVTLTVVAALLTTSV